MERWYIVLVQFCGKENYKQIEKFLLMHSNFKLIEKINLYPHIDGTDGFFIAVLERIN